MHIIHGRMRTLNKNSDTRPCYQTQAPVELHVNVDIVSNELMPDLRYTTELQRCPCHQEGTEHILSAIKS